MSEITRKECTDSVKAWKTQLNSKEKMQKLTVKDRKIVNTVMNRALTGEMEDGKQITPEKLSALNKRIKEIRLPETGKIDDTGATKIRSKRFTAKISRTFQNLIRTRKGSQKLFDKLQKADPTTSEPRLEILPQNYESLKKEIETLSTTFKTDIEKLKQSSTMGTKQVLNQAILLVNEYTATANKKIKLSINNNIITESQADKLGEFFEGPLSKVLDSFIGRWLEEDSPSVSYRSLEELSSELNGSIKFAQNFLIELQGKSKEQPGLNTKEKITNTWKSKIELLEGHALNRINNFKGLALNKKNEFAYEYKDQIAEVNNSFNKWINENPELFKDGPTIESVSSSSETEDTLTPLEQMTEGVNRLKEFKNKLQKNTQPASVSFKKKIWEEFVESIKQYAFFKIGNAKNITDDEITKLENEFKNQSDELTRSYHQWIDANPQLFTK